MSLLSLRDYFIKILIEHQWLHDICNIVLPSYCHRCDARLITDENPFFCPECWSKIPKIDRPFCSLCGKPHPLAIGFGTRSNFPCAQCRDKPNKYIEIIQSAVVYKDIARDALLLFKYYKQIHMAKPLGELLKDWIREEIDTEHYDLLIPVPLHPYRLKRRGFNQSQLLAKEIIPLFPQAELSETLIRIRPTITQTSLPPNERKNNVLGAFSVKDPPNIKGKRILLIDDIVTTATTVTECAKVLKKAGAKSVHVLSVARATYVPDMENV